MLALFALRVAPVVGLWLMGLAASSAWAQAPGLVLRSSPHLQEVPSAQESRLGALHLEADRMQVQVDKQAILEGGAQLRRPGLKVTADWLSYAQDEDLLQAKGHVRIQRPEWQVEGPQAQLQLSSAVGQFERPRYWLTQGGYGDAEQLQFVDQDRMVLHQARYTTCRATPGPQWLPEWLVQATRIETDTAEGVAVAKDLQVEFMGLRTPSFPDVRFPLDSQRSSGLLTPVLSIDSISGLDYMQPYYWDIAPNRDATVVARLMTRRGVGLESEFRYLETDYNGQLRWNWLPHDTLRSRGRWGLQTQHSGRIETGWEGLGAVGVDISLNRVSDDAYWRDFPRSYLGAVGATGTTLGLTQRTLPSTALLSWGRGALSLVGRVQRWQTQQDSSSFIVPPYDRVPQITLSYQGSNERGLEWSVVGDTTRFEADHSRIPAGMATLYNGTRSFTRAQLSRPFVASWGHLTPKVQLHATRYDMQAPLGDGRSIVNRVLPTLSVDGGLVFERETRWFDRALLQTLEPRIFYARTPFQEQSQLPLYDTGLTDFNLSTLYSENPYVGQDRIVDSNALTFGVNSRWFDPSTGAELLRLGLAQRLRLSTQRVSLNAANAAEDQKGLSDLLLAGSLRWSDPFWLDSALQLNNQTHAVQRSTLQWRYNPGPYRLLTAAYRLNRNTAPASELIDVGWQWPLSDLRWGPRPDDSGVRHLGQGLGAERWYSVGRVNYSTQDRKVVNALLGFEYDAGCWIARVALEKLQTTTTASNTRVMVQLELIGFGRVGVSPLDALKRNIPRYQFLRDTPAASSRFLNYE